MNPATFGQDEVMRVLAAFDGSDFALRAIRRALAMLSPASEITLLYVVPSAVRATGLPTALGVDIEPVLTPDMTDDAKRAAAEETSAAIADLGIDADVRIEVGEPGPVLCRVARSENFDLLVVGSHGTGVFKRMLLGSTSHHVAHHAPCPVLVIRETGERS